MPRSPSFPFRSSLAVLAFVLIAAVLCACSPTYDWRSVGNDDAGFAVMYPAKPTLDERQIAVAGQTLPMQMQAAQAGGAVFAVGVVTLPADDPALRAQVLDFLAAGIARNVGSTPRLRPIRIASAQSDRQIAGVAFAASGVVLHQRERRVVHARFAASGRHVYEAVVVSAAEPPAEQIDQFFDSWRLY